MASMSVKEARKKFAAVVEAARRGSAITITRRGQKVALITGTNGKTGGGLPDLTDFRASLKSGARNRGATIEKLRRSERY